MMLRILIATIMVSFLATGIPQAQEIPQKPFFDFFKKLIEKPKPKKRKPVRRAPVKTVQKKVIPPLQISIMGISGEEGSRVAICRFKNEVMLLEEGDQKGNDFKVIRIDASKMTVLHIAAGRRQEITMSDV